MSLATSLRPLLLLSVLPLLGCPGPSKPPDAGPPDAGSTDDAGTTEQALTLQGRAFDALTAAPLAQVTIVGAGGVTATTDGDGGFQLSVPAASSRLVASKQGYATTYLPLAPAAQAVATAALYREVLLLPVDLSAPVDATAGGQLTLGATTSITFPAQAFQRLDGAAVTGSVDVALTVLDPTNPPEVAAFPGGFGARRMDGSTGLLQSYAAVDITATQAGQPLALAAGKTVHVHFPVPDTLDAPATIPLWSLSPTTGSWVEEGTATKQVVNGEAIYVADLPHLSWWNCDTFAQVTCVRGCVTFQGQPVPNAHMTARAAGVASQGGGFTGPTGCFAEDVPAGVQLVVTAAAIQGVSAPKTVMSSTTLRRAAQDPTACQDLGTFELIARPVASNCPSGQQPCSGSCVDLTTDDLNCGSCGARCMTGETGALTCVAGVCSCAPGLSLCSSYCTNLRTDRNNCGTCGTRCPTGQRCSAGACAAIVCGAGETLCGDTCATLATDPSHCGSCTNSCTGESGGGICVNGSCQCPAGLTNCSQTSSLMCLNLLGNDRANCGACRNACAANQTCDAGTCQTITCPSGQTLCGLECADLQTSPGHCGQCNHGCSSGDFVGGTCVGGQCVCPTGQTNCSAQPGVLDCRDLSVDRRSCGACGNPCYTGERCDGGTCGLLTCSAGQTVCGDACVDLQTTASHCGACGQPCIGSMGCSGGACSCASGLQICAGGGDFGITCQATCSAPIPAATCATMAGRWAMDFTPCAFGTPTCDLVQAGCALGSSCFATGALTAATTVVFNTYGATCTGTLTGDTVSGSCVHPTAGTCGFSGTRQVCPSGQRRCNGACVDPLTSQVHCGFCNNVCVPPQSCTAGRCQR